MYTGCGAVAAVGLAVAVASLRLNVKAMLAHDRAGVLAALG
jgi:hypothetical protein